MQVYMLKGWCLLFEFFLSLKEKWKDSITIHNQGYSTRCLTVKESRRGSRDFTVYYWKVKYPRGPQRTNTHAPHQSTGTAALECFGGFDPGGNASTLSLRVTIHAPSPPPRGSRVTRALTNFKEKFQWKRGCSAVLLVLDSQESLVFQLLIFVTIKIANKQKFKSLISWAVNTMKQ